MQEQGERRQQGVPSINDIVELADVLERKAVLPVDNRCVAVRNRNAKCRRCVDACLADAITIEKNILSIDSATCVSCGACTTVCPTEALVSLFPLDEDLAERVAQACVETGKAAMIACARISSRREADPQRYAEVPCLARVEESLLLGLVKHGADSIVLVDGTCKTCKYKACDTGIDATVDSANSLLAMVGHPLRIERASAFPEAAMAPQGASLYGVSRRGFFTDARGIAKDATEKTITYALDSEKVKKAESLRERLRVSDKGTLPQFVPVRRMGALDALDALGEPVIPELETRLWGTVDIDLDACSACDMCSLFCPTGALRKTTEEVEGEEAAVLEFSLAECVQCGTCADICLKKCLSVSPIIPTSELFDFEPRIFVLPVIEKKGAFPKMNRY